MKLVLVAAMDRNRLIGRAQGLPWRLPADLAHFRRTTMGKPVLMGRRTYDAIGRVPLPGRRNVVITTQPDYEAPGAEVVGSIEQALALLAAEDEVMVCGGSTLYEALLPRAHRLVLTFVDADLEGDTWFPAWDPTVWDEVERREHPADERNAYACEFVTYERHVG